MNNVTLGGVESSDRPPVRVLRDDGRRHGRTPRAGGPLRRAHAHEQHAQHAGRGDRALPAGAHPAVLAAPRQRRRGPQSGRRRHRARVRNAHRHVGDRAVRAPAARAVRRPRRRARRARHATRSSATAARKRCRERSNCSFARAIGFGSRRLAAAGMARPDRTTKDCRKPYSRRHGGTGTEGLSLEGCVPRRRKTFRVLPCPPSPPCPRSGLRRIR